MPGLSDATQAEVKYFIPDQTFTPAPWQFLYFLPLPHGHGSFLPIFCSTRTGCTLCCGGGPCGRPLAAFAVEASALLETVRLMSVFGCGLASRTWPGSC